MDPNDRANAVVAHVNEALRGAGVPEVSWHFDSSKGVNAAFDFQTWQMAHVMSIPVTIAQCAADPILQCDASQYEAEEWYQSVYGAGHDARNATLNDVQNHYQDYRNLPEEHDAWATGDGVTSQMQHPNQ